MTERTDASSVTSDQRDTGDRSDPSEDGSQVDDTSVSLSRRRLLGTVGAAGAGGVALGATGTALGQALTGDESPPALAEVGTASVPFHGTHQAGITTPQQAHGHLAAFDLAPGAGRKDAAALLRRWSRAAARLMAGEPTDDRTGIARDAGPCSLTVTFGFGRSFFGRTGLTDQIPTALAPLPPFTRDALDDGRSNGDLWVQIGADDGLVAFDALRILERQATADAHTGARLRWQMSGFNRTPGATPHPMTVRNLMGQVDGTNNPKPSDDNFDERIFVPSDGSPAWMAGGSYAVVRRIRMLLDTWGDKSRVAQEEVIGRRKPDGAPLSGGTENTPVDLTKRTADGDLAIARNAHIRVSAPETNGGAAMLRRSYSFHDGYRDDGAPDAGLLFVAWQADPLRGFVPVQRKLDSGDALSPFIRHEASGLFAVPGGPSQGEYVGQRLLEGW